MRRWASGLVALAGAVSCVSEVEPGFDTPEFQQQADASVAGGTGGTTGGSGGTTGGSGGSGALGGSGGVTGGSGGTAGSDASDAPPTGPHAIASGLPAPRWIAARTGVVAYTTESATSGQVGFVDPSGGPPTVLATGQKNPQRITVNVAGPLVAYWTSLDDGTVWTSGSPTPAWSGQNQPLGIAVMSSDVYWTNRGAGTVVVNGLFFSSNEQSPSTLVTANARLYWIGGNDTQVRSAAVGNPTTTLGSDASGIVALGAFGDDVFFATGGGELKKCASAGCATSSQTLASGLPNVMDLAVNANGVYLTQKGSAASDGSVSRVPISGGTPTSIAQAQSQPHGVALAGGEVYWANKGSGEIMAAPEP